jgi:uncharacterized damage-inducible protein DinB
MNEIASIFLAASVKSMELSEQDILKCLAKLSDAQFFARGAEHENSVANILLHLAGNLRQWILHGVDGEADVRERDAEFALELSLERSEVCARFSTTVSECRRVISVLSPDRLQTLIDPQPTGNWRSMTILEAIYRIVAHLQMHTGQIILLTKQMTGRDLDLTIPRKR